MIFYYFNVSMHGNVRDDKNQQGKLSGSASSCIIIVGASYIMIAVFGLGHNLLCLSAFQIPRSNCYFSLPFSCYTLPCKLVTKNWVLDHYKNLHLISLSFLITCLLDYVSYYRKKLHVHHFSELKRQERVHNHRLRADITQTNHSSNIFSLIT